MSHQSSLIRCYWPIREPRTARSVEVMTRAIQAAGFVITLVGVSGTIDRLWYQPIMGVLNVLNRHVFASIDFLHGYELFANLTVVITGVVIMAAASKKEQMS